MAAVVLPDLIDLLTDQHGRLDQACSAITDAEDGDRSRRLDSFRRLIQRHLAGDRVVVYPAVRDHTGPGGPALARAWTAQEQRLHQAVTDLTTLTATDPRFAKRLATVRAALRAHSTHEEHDAFPQLRCHIPTQKLHLMANEIVNRQTLNWHSRRNQTDAQERRHLIQRSSRTGIPHN